MAKGGKRKINAGDVASNRQAAFRYDFLDKLECGMVLTGTEIKAIRTGTIQLKDGFVMIRDGELFLHNVHIPPYGPAARDNHDPERVRKLLAKRGEIDKLAAELKEKGHALVPTRVYFKGSKAKVEVALGRGKDRFDKRESIKKRDSERDMQRALRDAGR